MRKYYILLLVTLLILPGCASLPSTQEMEAEIQGFALPKMPESGKAIVYIVRPSPLGLLIRFNVYLDGKGDESKMGYTKGSEYIYFNVRPGEHKILSKAENWAEAMITARAGDTIFLKQHPSMGLVMARNSLLQLEQTEGKYHVKKLTPGTMLKFDP